MKQLVVATSLIGASLVGIGSAAAQQADAQPDGSYQGDPNQPDPNADPNAAPSPDPTTYTFLSPLDHWPTRLLDRPITLPYGLIRAQGDLGIARINGNNASTTSSLLASASYGVSDKFELGASYALALDPFDAKGAVAGNALFKIAETPGVKAAATGQLTYDLNGDIGTLGLGLQAQINLGPSFALLFPGNQLQTTVIRDQGVARVSTLSLPIGLGFQANPHLFFFAQTNATSIDLNGSAEVDGDGNATASGSATVVFGRDGEPLTVGMFYAPTNEVELGAAINYPNLEQADKVWNVVLTARLFIAN